MKIYFAGSISGGRNDAQLYARLIIHLSQYGTVLTEHVGESSLTSQGEGNAPLIYSRDVSWIEESDLLVAEVTTPSLGVGYEIAYAESRGIPVVCLYRNRTSGMIMGNPYPTNILYSSEIDAYAKIDAYFTVQEENI